MLTYYKTAGKDFAWRGASNGRGHAHGFIDAGAEVSAGVKFGTRPYLLDGGKCGADFLSKAGERRGIMEEVKECCCKGRRSRVGP